MLLKQPREVIGAREAASFRYCRYAERTLGQELLHLLNTDSDYKLLWRAAEMILKEPSEIHLAHITFGGQVLVGKREVTVTAPYHTESTSQLTWDVVRA